MECSVVVQSQSRRFHERFDRSRTFNHRSIEDLMGTLSYDRLEQLVAQRDRYELARRSASDEAVAARHAATVSRLDAQIEEQRRMLETGDPSVSLPSRPCVAIERRASELSGRYGKVRWARLAGAWSSLRARIPAAVWLAIVVALIVGATVTSLGVMLEPSLARAAGHGTPIVRE
jgi:hypothetical protein